MIEKILLELFFIRKKVFSGLKHFMENRPFLQKCLWKMFKSVALTFQTSAGRTM